ncbi:MAG: DUF3846 domain-containing protein [Bacteroidales bacterium]|nr:DUF3846 domain-containing protein [Bacteroidales bacterium]
MGKIFRTNGTIEDVMPANGKDYQLDELQKIVGGFIEIVDLSGGQIMVINEEGKLYGLDKNNEATGRFRESVLRRFGYKTKDYIVGDVLVCNSNEVK